MSEPVYKDPEWLRTQYIHLQKSIWAIAKEYNIPKSTLEYQLKRTGIPMRKRTELSLGRKHSPETRARISEFHKGKHLSAEHKAKLSAATKGRTRPPFSEETKLRMSISAQGKHAGPANGNWKGGTTPARKRMAWQSTWLHFREFIHIRDNFTCVRCGHTQADTQLQVHHIQNWAENPDLRFDPANCITLCQPCHDWVESKANVNREFLK